MAASYTSVHQLYAAATSVGGDSVASMVVPVSSRIVATKISYISVSAALIGRAELSLQSTNQFIVNDARQVLNTVLADWANTLGDALSLAPVLCDVPVTEMDRIYLHVLQTSAAWRVACLVWLRHG